MDRTPVRTIAGLALALYFSGCTTITKPVEPVQIATLTRHMVRAEEMYKQGNYAGAMIACIDQTQANPDAPGLPAMKAKIMAALTIQREQRARMHAESTGARMSVDIEQRNNVPYSYGLRRQIRGDNSIMRAPPTAMEKALQRPVVVHLDQVDLNSFILEIGKDSGVNIIADSNLSGAGTMTIHAEDVPLSEILDYVSRNLGISFYVGRNVIWVTQRDTSESDVPLETRMYRLRRGISSEEISADEAGIDIIKAIERFVPDAQGSDIMFNMKAHVLIVKNTRSNLAKIESIIETLDVCPPQVLIEARFISTSVADLSELGIDWILNTPLVLTKNQGESHTEISGDASIKFAPFAGGAEGMNFAYQGLLTDPMFRAVLHALETSGRSQTLSVPKVTTVNNRPAMIRIGEDFRYFEEYDLQQTPSVRSSTGDTIYESALVPVGAPLVEELGIQLDVIPSVGADMRSITLNIVPSIKEFVRWEYYQTSSRSGSTTSGGSAATNNATALIKLPIFRESKLETELIVQSGETIVMGGLITSTKTKGESRVPILSSIPLLGRLFRHDTIEETKRNLLIFVTATILSQRGESLVPMYDSLGPN